MIRSLKHFTMLCTLGEKFLLRSNLVLMGDKACVCTTRIALDIFEITGEEDFKKRVMGSTLPVIVNFHADWCEPCHTLKPLLKSIAQANLGKINLAEIIVDSHAGLLQAFEVTAVPAVLAIHKGEVIDKFIGLISHKEISDFINRFLEKLE